MSRDGPPIPQPANRSGEGVSVAALDLLASVEAARAFPLDEGVKLDHRFDMGPDGGTVRPQIRCDNRPRRFGSSLVNVSPQGIISPPSTTTTDPVM